ncbi:MAG: PQQ-dependent dehydrogenase, methanol/ethanol family [Hyphomicrobiaceae bacterium]
MKSIARSAAFIAMLGMSSSAWAGGWEVYGGDTGNQRYSTESQITPENVGKLRVAWALQLGSVRSQESTPLVIGDTLYVSSSFGPKNVFAADAATGTIKWTYSPEMPRGVDQFACCDVNNRGVSYSDGVIYVGLLDAHVVALDANSGKELWKTKIVDYKQGSVITSPPTIAKNVVITGFGGGEYGVRGALVGLDKKSGKELWRSYMVPGPGEPGHDTWKGDSWKQGGGAAWHIGSYDPKLNLVYYGTSNPAPWTAAIRGNDSQKMGKYTNLHTSATVAINPEDGKIAWSYQSTPHDAWDYDGVNELVFADMDVDGKSTPVVMKADRNGFFYVINRANGKLISAESFVPGMNWATGVDLKTGRPIEAAGDVKRPRLNKKASNICPNLVGGKNWQPMSYSKQTGLVYIMTNNLCMDLEGIMPEFKRGTFYLGVNFNLDIEGPGGYLGGTLAWDPVKQKEAWYNKSALPFGGGMTSTATGLLFHGDLTGNFYALDAKTGKELWKFQTGSGIHAAPITYSVGGKQYVAVVSGRQRSMPSFFGKIGKKMAVTPEGGTLFVFALN